MFYLVDEFGGLFYGTDVADQLRFVREYDVEFTDIAVETSTADPEGGDPLLGRIFAIDDDTLYEIDIEDFTISTIGALTLDGAAFDGAEALEWAAGALWVAGDETTGLYTVDVDTGALTLVGDTGANAEGDLIFAANLVWMSTTDETFLALDPTDASTQITVDHGIIGLEGLAETDGGLFGFAEDLYYEFDAGALEFNFGGTLADDPQSPFIETSGAGEISVDGVISVATKEQAEIIALLFEAALDRDGAIDLAGLNFWIDALEGDNDAGQAFTIEEIAEEFLESPEFTEVVGDVDTLTDQELVEALYVNILNRDGEQAGIDFWTATVGGDDFSRADLLTAFAVSTENFANSPFVDSLVEVTGGFWNFLDNAEADMMV